MGQRKQQAFLKQNKQLRESKKVENRFAYLDTFLIVKEEV